MKKDEAAVWSSLKYAGQGGVGLRANPKGARHLGLGLELESRSARRKEGDDGLSPAGFVLSLRLPSLPVGHAKADPRDLHT